MKEELRLFLEQFKELSTHEVDQLTEELVLEAVAKDAEIVREGQSCNLCYFVLKGCLRQFVIVDGVEKTIAIYTEGQAINYYTNPSESKPSDNYLCAIEASVLLVGDPVKDEAVYAKYPALVNITRKMIEADLGKARESLTKFMISSPEERYLNLLKDRPDLIQRVPQHMLASFLGVTPESLSRIRRRIHAN